MFLTSGLFQSTSCVAMQLTREADYAVRVVLDLAEHAGDGPVRSADVARRQMVPKPWPRGYCAGGSTGCGSGSAGCACAPAPSGRRSAAIPATAYTTAAAMNGASGATS